MATKIDLHELELRMNDKVDGLRTSMRNWLVLGFAVLAALITFFGLVNSPP